MNILTDSNLEDTMDKINDATQYLSQTIEDFRVFFDPRNTKKSDIIISETIEKTLKIISAKFLIDEIEIVKNIEKVTVFSIENELMQVLINILNNSRDALLQLENSKKFIFIFIRKYDNNLEIEIKDNGKGLCNDILSKVFEPYFTTKHQSQGTGIGLYMSQDIIRNHFNGTIELSNETYVYDEIEYKGAKVSIKIPLS